MQISTLAYTRNGNQRIQTQERGVVLKYPARLGNSSSLVLKYPVRLGKNLTLRRQGKRGVVLKYPARLGNSSSLVLKYPVRLGNSSSLVQLIAAVENKLTLEITQQTISNPSTTLVDAKPHICGLASPPCIFIQTSNNTEVDKLITGSISPYKTQRNPACNVRYQVWMAVGTRNQLIIICFILGLNEIAWGGWQCADLHIATS